MTEPNEYYAYFTVCGDFDPADISKLVGVTPTDAWVKGSINPRTRRERTFSRWSLCSRLERSCKLEAHIVDVVEQLRTKKADFVALSSRYGGMMEVVAYFKTDYPGLHLERGVVQALAEYGLGVNFDFYYLYSDRREDSA